MLEKLLEEIRRGGTLETGALAKKLGTTPQMVQVLLEHLQRTGHISPYQGCQGAARPAVEAPAANLNLARVPPGCGRDSEPRTASRKGTGIGLTTEFTPEPHAKIMQDFTMPAPTASKSVL